MQTYENFIRILKENIHIETGIPLSDMQYAMKGEISAPNGDRLLITIRKTAHTIQTCGVHIRELFESYQDGISTERIINQITAQIAQMNELHVDDLPVIISDYEKVKSRLFVRAVSIDQHGSELKDIVYRQIGDIALVLSYMISNPTDSEIASTKIQQRFFDSWKKSKDEVFATAFANIYATTPPRLYTWEMLLSNPSMPGKDFMNSDEPDLFSKAVTGNCISTTTRTNGAIAVFLPGVVKRISECLDDDFYIAFTSIHEAMVHATKTVTVEALQDVLTETINDTVDNDEFLSYRIFHYSRDTQKFTCITK